MKLIYKGKGEGKTHDLIEWLLAKNNRVIVVSTIAERDDISRRLYDRGVESKGKVVFYKDYVDNRTRGAEIEIGVDNADALLNKLLDYKVKAITVDDGDTEEEETVIRDKQLSDKNDNSEYWRLRKLIDPKDPFKY